MQSWSSIVADVRQWWWIYLSMPLIAGGIGWFTKLIAIEMMFRPLEFVGVRLGRIPLGWQGMLPRQAEKMAGIAYDMISTNLLQPQELFDRLDADRLIKEVEAPMRRAVDDVVRSMAIDYYPGLWEAMPELTRHAVIGLIQSETPKYAVAAIEDAKRDIVRLFDLRAMVISNLTADKALLNRMMRDIAGAQMTMIPKIGFWFGLLIGVGQAIMWALFREPWLMPVFGFVNGWITDYIGLQMLFRPHEPKRYFGIFTWHGLFAKNRHELIPQYAHLIAAELLTPDKIVDAILKGPAADRVFELAAKYVDRAADAAPSLAKPLVTLTVGTDRWRELKATAAERVFAYAEATTQQAHAYTMQAMDIENTVIERMGELSPAQFENLLRPAVKEDEPTAIAVGAVLGGVVGELQILLIERITLDHWAWPLGLFLH
ncbi:DUF445 domain-containing protein [Nocardia sp. NPDC004278]